MSWFWVAVAAPFWRQHSKCRNRFAQGIVRFRTYGADHGLCNWSHFGCHLNPAVSVGLAVGGRFKTSDLLPYIVAQVLVQLLAPGCCSFIASGKAGFDLSGGLASNGCREHSRWLYTRCRARYRSRNDLHVPHNHPGRHRRARTQGTGADRHRSGSHADSPHKQPGYDTSLTGA